MVAPSSAVQVVAFLSNTPIVEELANVRGPAPPEPTNVMMSPSSKLEEATVIEAYIKNLKYEQIKFIKQKPRDCEVFSIWIDNIFLSYLFKLVKFFFPASPDFYFGFSSNDLFSQFVASG